MGIASHVHSASTNRWEAQVHVRVDPVRSSVPALVPQGMAASTNGKMRRRAPALSVRQWKLWLDWLLSTSGARIYFVVFLTGAFGLRCSEALALKREDVNLDGTIPKLSITGETKGARKPPGDVYIRKQHLKNLKAHLANGIKSERPIKHKHGKGRKKTILRKEAFHIPKSGYIFTSRKGSNAAHLHYHAAYQHVVRQAPKFFHHLEAIGEKVSPEIKRIRPHSGRATLITELMGEGMTTAMSMKYARHSSGSFKVHLRYGQLTLADVKKACDRLSDSSKKTKWGTWTTKNLLIAQKQVQKELAKRMTS